MRGRPVAFILLAAIAGAQDSRSAAADRVAPAGRSAFESGLKVAQSAAAQGRFKPARDQVTELLRAHANADYVFARKIEIGELVRKCCFAIQYPDPNPKTLISGQLLAWDPQSGAIKLRYTRETMADWSEGSSRSHPIHWRGSYSIELRGSSYPKVDDCAQVYVCGSRDAAIWVTCGTAAETAGMSSQWRPAELEAFEKNDKKTLLDKKEEPPCRSGKPYAIKVSVTDSQVIVTYNSRALLSGKRLKDPGYLGFSGIEPEEVILEGKAEGSWIQGVQDKVREKNRKEFEASFDPARELPVWLLSGRPAAKARLVAAEEQFPEELEERHLAVALQARKLLWKRDLATGIRFLEKLKPEELPYVTKSFLLAAFFEEADRFGEAEPLLVSVRTAVPDFAPAACALARIWSRTGRAQQAGELFDKALAAAPDDCNIAVEAATWALLSGRSTRAKAIIDAALAKGLHSRELERVNALLVKAIDGPPWPKRYEFQSQNFVVASDIDRKTCEEAAKVLEDSLVAYTTWLDRVPGSGTDRFKVYLFSGEAGYQAWSKDLLSNVPQHTAGLYSSYLKILLIWNLPSREDMMRTVRHEGFHQYLDRLVQDPPVWLNEGLAEYFENAKLENGTWKAPDVHPQHAAVLSPGALSPLAEFLFETPLTFYKDSSRNYAQAWAFVTFLRHSTPENKQLFQKLWSAVRENAGGYAAVTRTFTPSEMTRLDRELAAWVASKR